MGWTFTPSFTKADLVKERTDRAIKRFTGTGGAEIETEVLDHSLRGNRLWKLVRYKKHGKEEVFIALDLLAYDKRHGAGYKDMEESSGPHVYDCPLKFLDRAPEPERSESVIEWDQARHGGMSWRDRVRAWHKGQREKAKKTIEPGRKYALTSIRVGHGKARLHWIRIIEASARHKGQFLAVANDGNTYRFTKGMIGEELMGKETTAGEMMDSLGL